MHSAVRKLKNGKASGPDKIPATIIKDVGDLITKPLTMIFSLSLRNGVSPDTWKIARITLLSNLVQKKMSIVIRPFQSFGFLKDLGENSS